MIYGWGAQALGGKGGDIIEVTNLNNSGKGSFRNALQTAGIRNIVFRVAGQIDLTNPIYIEHPYLTVAGHIAPKPGITITGGPIILYTNNVIIGYLRWRGGGDGFLQLKEWNGCHDVVINHCSMSECENHHISIYFDEEEKPDIRNITIQNCLFSSALPVHPTALVVGSISGLNHRVYNISIHNNLFVNNSHRNPLCSSRHTEVINNVISNWEVRAAGIGGGAEIDFINNFYLPGIDTVTTKPIITHQPAKFDKLSSIYIAGNITPKHVDDDWELIKVLDDPEYPQLPEFHRRFIPLSKPLSPVPIRTAKESIQKVLSIAGASRLLNGNGEWFDNRDERDKKIVEDLILLGG